MRIVVIGAGAMGCLYGAYLSQHNEVILLDSYAPQVDAINEGGIAVTAIDGTTLCYPDVRACLSGQYNETADMVILFVKSGFTQEALETNKALFGPQTTVLTLQNGAGHDRKIQRYVAPENIVIGTTKHNAVNMGAGRCQHGGTGVTTIGSNSDAAAALEKVSGVLREAGFETVQSEDIQRIIWSKLFVNLSINTFTAITQTPIGYMVQDQHAWDFAKRLVYEACDVAEEDGTYFDRREALEQVRQVCLAASKGYSSMYQDVKNKRKTEIDAINGAIVEQAKLYGVSVPYNALIVDLLHAIEGAYCYREEQEGPAQNQQPKSD